MILPQAEGWDWFASPSTKPKDETAKVFVDCFATPSGKVVLAHLRKHILERRLPGSASADELRHLEGERSAIAYIERLAHSAATPSKEEADA